MVSNPLLFLFTVTLYNQLVFPSGPAVVAPDRRCTVCTLWSELRQWFPGISWPQSIQLNIDKTVHAVHVCAIRISRSRWWPRVAAVPRAAIIGPTAETKEISGNTDNIITAFLQSGQRLVRCTDNKDNRTQFEWKRSLPGLGGSAAPRHHISPSCNPCTPVFCSKNFQFAKQIVQSFTCSIIGTIL